VNYLRLHGIDIGQLHILCVKAKNHFRAAFGPLCRTFIEVDTPGPAGVDLGALPYRHAPLDLVRAVNG
jgi:microcystin degradation protein MlrC